MPIDPVIEEAVAARSPGELSQRSVRQDVLIEVLNHPQIKPALEDMARLFPESRPDEAVASVIGRQIASALRRARARRPRTPQPTRVVLTRVK